VADRYVRVPHAGGNIMTSMRTSSACTLEEAGVTWDAIRVPMTAGLVAMGILGSRCGAVVEAPSGCLYFFTPRGTASGWSVETTRAIGAGGVVTIPPARRMAGPGPHWRICPIDGGMLTNPDALKAAIDEALSTRAGQTG
jgi:hypothetical protein